jgi:hypothetical protein
MYQAKVLLLSFGCVTHFIVQINIEQKVQECDATEALYLSKSLAQKYSLENLYTIAIS